LKLIGQWDIPCGRLSYSDDAPAQADVPSDKSNVGGGTVGEADSGITTLLIGLHDGVVSLTSDDGTSWRQGPVSPLPHAAAKITACPSDPKRAYLAAYEAGVYRTDDLGVTWWRLNSYPTTHAHSLAVHPSNADILFVGSEPASVFVTMNGGSTWDECSAFRDVPEADQWSFHWEGRHGHVRDLRMAHYDANIIFAGIEVGGVIRSMDGGQNWKQLAGLDPDVHTIQIDPVQRGTVLVATAAGPYRSEDNGDSWEYVDGGLERSHTIPLAMSSGDPERVLVGAASSARRQDAESYLSTNGGRAWRRLEGVGSSEDMVVAWAWDSVDPSRAYAGTDAGKICASSDHGESWRMLEVDLPRVAVGAMAVAYPS
jgi:photosystem II stability/assembly factor-like uncharacterized protein